MEKGSLPTMLEVLRITNYAIIDELEVEFSRGLTAITGETGAGKSIILGAFRILLGGRATSEVVRSGCQRAGIEGIFHQVSADAGAWLKHNDFYPDEPEEQDTLIVRRDILASGSSRNFINGRSANVTQLKELGTLLVDMHGQNDHTRLHSPVTQLLVLDSYGSYGKELKEYQSAYVEWKSARDRFESLSTDQGDAQRRRDFLEFQVDEITRAEPKPGEDEELDQERRRLVNAERLTEICGSVCDILYEGERSENPAGAQVAAASKLLQELATLDPAQESLAAEAESIRFALEDLSEKVRDYIDSVAGDPERLSQVDDRLELLKNLKRKYGSTLEEVIATGERLAAELNDIVNHDAALEEAQSRLMAAEKTAGAAAEKLTAARQKAARIFEKQVQSVMRELELPKAVLKIELTSGTSVETGAAAGVAEGAVKGASEGTVKDLSARADVSRRSFSPSGQDTIEFMVSLNAGESPKPMRKVASGGEISRIMLSIKSVLADRDNVPTLVFDEIDTGISGQAAARVGAQLEQLAASHQVMCITHLPQVAARGHLHLVVEKQTVKDRTVTAVQKVEGEERTLALARMLSGHEVDDTTRKFAEKLLVKSEAK